MWAKSATSKIISPVPKQHFLHATVFHQQGAFFASITGPVTRERRSTNPFSRCLFGTGKAASGSTPDRSNRVRLVKRTHFQFFTHYIRRCPYFSRLFPSLWANCTQSSSLCLLPRLRAPGIQNSLATADPSDSYRQTPSCSRSLMPSQNLKGNRHSINTLFFATLVQASSQVHIGCKSRSRCFFFGS